jgi:DNA polymerase-3 subunit epsilon
MIICANDTETSGLPLWREPSTDARQPHIVQLAAMLINDTPAGATVMQQMSRIVRPDGWSWSHDDESFKAHGITMERAMDEGITEREAIEEYLSMHDLGQLRVAHNGSFDDRILRIAMKRYGYSDTSADEYRDYVSFCTMRSSTAICKLPTTARQKEAGYGNGYKNPKLTEAFQHFFGFTFDGAHDALNDTKACADVYLAIQRGIKVPVFTERLGAPA